MTRKMLGHPRLGRYPRHTHAGIHDEMPFCDREPECQELRMRAPGELTASQTLAGAYARQRHNEGHLWTSGCDIDPKCVPMEWSGPVTPGVTDVPLPEPEEEPRRIYALRDGTPAPGAIPHRYDPTYCNSGGCVPVPGVVLPDVVTEEIIPTVTEDEAPPSAADEMTLTLADVRNLIADEEKELEVASDEIFLTVEQVRGLLSQMEICEYGIVGLWMEPGIVHERLSQTFYTDEECDALVAEQGEEDS